MALKADYSPPLFHRHVHFSTIIPNRFRKIRSLTYQRQTLNTPDGDFIDLDVSSIGSTGCLLLLHGLEGSSQSTYMKGLAKYANDQGFDAVAMNHRSCSGKPNNLAISYHSGKTDDVAAVVQALSATYESIHIVGFSLGGNMALKLAGEWAQAHPKQVKSVVGVSVPCDLASSALKLGLAENRIYLWRFLSQLKAKARAKALRFPDANLDLKLIKQSDTFKAFDDAYTAPAHGFQSAADYYEKCSSKAFIPNIEPPTLIINAKNDSFLSPSCYPINEVNENPNVGLLMPTFGGHVGFASDFMMNEAFWSEIQIMDFIASISKPKD